MKAMKISGLLLAAAVFTSPVAMAHKNHHDHGYRHDSHSYKKARHYGKDHGRQYKKKVIRRAERRGYRQAMKDVYRKNYHGEHHSHRHEHYNKYGAYHHPAPPVRYSQHYYHEKVRYRSRHHDSPLPIIAGGIVGGVIGSELGHGDPVTTSMGTIIGSVAGHSIGH